MQNIQGTASNRVTFTSTPSRGSEVARPPRVWVDVDLAAGLAGVYLRVGPKSLGPSHLVPPVDRLLAALEETSTGRRRHSRQT
jgi:hypothetical protein